MKRAPAFDKHGRQSAEQYAPATKASISKEEGNPTAETKGSGSSPFKKIKLSVRKNSASAKHASHAEETEQRPTSPISSPRRETAKAAQTTQPQPPAMHNASASMPVLRDASSKLYTTTEATVAVAATDTQAQASSGPAQTTSSSPETDTAARRQQWLDRDKPSFVFDEITDPTLLALFDTPASAGTPPASTPRPSEREQKRQFRPIADAIKTALENVLANVMRKFMEAVKQDGARTPEFQAAHHTLTELVQMLNRAKVAAFNGQEAEMIAELRKFCPVLEQFIVRGLKDTAQQFNAEKSDRDALKTGLRNLLAQCREWSGERKEEGSPSWSPSHAPASPQSRQRSVSSPVKQNERWAELEAAKANRLSASFSGLIGLHPSQHRLGTASITGTAATLSPTSTPPGSPLSSPVQSPKNIVSPKGSTKSLFLSTLAGSPGSPRAKDASRQDSFIKDQGRQSVLNESTSQSSLSVQQSDKPAAAEKAKAEKSKKKLS